MGREMLAVGFFLCYCQAKVGIAHDDIQLSILLILSFSSARVTDMLFLSLSLLNLFFFSNFSFNSAQEIRPLT